MLHPFTTDSKVTLDDQHSDAGVRCSGLIDCVEAEMSAAFGWDREMPDDELHAYLDGAYAEYLADCRRCEEAAALNDHERQWLTKFRREYVATMPEAVLTDWLEFGDEKLARCYSLPLGVIQQEAVAEFPSGVHPMNLNTALAPIRAAIVGISHESSIEAISAALGVLEALSDTLKSLKAELRQNMLDYVTINGELTIGDTRYYAGIETETRCNDVADTLRAMLETTNVETLAGCLSSSAWKPGACAKALPPAQFARCFTKTVKSVLADGKPRKTLQSVDTRFVNHPAGSLMPALQASLAYEASKRIA